MEKIITTGPGLTLCARYAFMPNKLKYCGPSNERTLFDYAAKNIIDRGLVELLSQFECLYPYLKGIARANKIEDPFDRRVVEAYWLGNSFLNNVSLNDLFFNLKEEHHLARRLPKKYFNEIINKIPAGAKPHHSFQVLNVFINTGRQDFKKIMPTLENCLIRSAKIKKIKDDFAAVEMNTLNYDNQKLSFDKKSKLVRFKFFGQAITQDLSVGELVSVHWGFICDKLSLNQAKRLAAWNQYHLNLANLTI